MLDEERRNFVTSPVMIVIGSRDEALRPAIGRGVGVRMAESDVLEILVSAWQWPETIDNIRRTGAAAVTFARPSDYISYQLKGAAWVSVADADDIALCAHYCETIAAVLGGLGMPSAIIAPWFVARDLVVIRVGVEAIFVQTPGINAGSRLETAP